MPSNQRSFPSKLELVVPSMSLSQPPHSATSSLELLLPDNVQEIDPLQVFAYENGKIGVKPHKMKSKRPFSPSPIVYGTSRPHSRQKLQQFFGTIDLAVVDDRHLAKLQKFYGFKQGNVCRAQNSAENSVLVDFTLSKVLEAPVPLLYFMAYCIQESLIQNLLFVIDVEYYDQNFKDRKGALRLLQEISDEYLSGRGSLDLKIDGKIKTKTMESFICGKSGIFDEILDIVLAELEAGFERFLHSDFYSLLIHDTDKCPKYTHFQAELATKLIWELIEIKGQRNQLADLKLENLVRANVAKLN